jgi:hypothetical protein
MNSMIRLTLVGLMVVVLAGCGSSTSSPGGTTVTGPSGAKTTPAGATERKVGAPQ